MTESSRELIRASSMYRVLEIIGDRWTLTILHQAFLGIHGFQELQQRLHIPRSTLSNRLKRLMEHDILAKRPARTPDQRWEYKLTEVGRDLLPAALLALTWQEQWVPGQPAPAVRHKACGGQLSPKLVCAHCERAVSARNVRYEPGPGCHRPTMENGRRRRSNARAGSSETLPISGELLDILGDRWTPQVLALGFFGIRRFDDMLPVLDVASNILTDRLKRLVAMDLLRQEVYQQRPVRKEYRLTPKSLALYPLLVGLTQWGDRWFTGPEGKPLWLFHTSCGHKLVSEIRCQHCEQPILPGSTELMQ